MFLEVKTPLSCGYGSLDEKCQETVNLQLEEKTVLFADAGNLLERLKCQKSMGKCVAPQGIYVRTAANTSK